MKTKTCIATLVLTLTAGAVWAQVTPEAGARNSTNAADAVQSMTGMSLEQLAALQSGSLDRMMAAALRCQAKVTKGFRDTPPIEN